MRRVLGAVVLALGVALVVLGATSSFLYDRLAKVSLDQKSTSVSEGRDMAALKVSSEGSSSKFEPLTGVTLRSTRQVLGIPGALSDGERDTRAVWQTGVRSEAVGVGPLTFSQELVTFDRVTGLATGDARDRRSAGDLDDPGKLEPVVHSGLFFKFPFAVEKKSYPWWDGDLGRAVPIAFQREDTLFGTPVYVFQQVIPVADVAPTRTVPAAVFGATGADVEATVRYGNTRTLWVEPNTGVIIKGQEQVDKSLTSSLGSVATTKGTIGYTDQTVRDNAEAWGTKGRLLGFIAGPMLWVGLVGGLVLIVLGTVLIGRRRADEGASGTPAVRHADEAGDDTAVGGLDELGVGGADTRRSRADRRAAERA